MVAAAGNDEEVMLAEANEHEQAELSAITII